MAINNHVHLAGYVSTGKDNPPLELKQAGSGDNSFSTLRFRLAVPRDRKEKDGSRKYDYINISAVGKTADFIAKYFGPGDVIAIEGELRTRMYEKDGEIKSSWEVYVTGATFPLGKNKNSNTDTAPASAAAPKAKATPAVDDFEEIDDSDDLPF